MTMHDLDRTFSELEGEYEDEYEDEYERAGEGEAGPGAGRAYEPSGETESYAVLDEAEVQELAAELLEVSNEAELDRFFDDIFGAATKALGSIADSVGKPLKGVLKSVAKKALPLAGAALGNMVAPGIGGAIGGKAASALGSLFGLELEGLSNEDREFEVAKQFVRLGADATAQALQTAQQGMSPPDAVKEAVVQAAQKYAPGLVQPSPPDEHPHDAHCDCPHHHHRHRTHGRWVRHGHKIVLLGV
jgi:hypothetical protein